MKTVDSDWEFDQVLALRYHVFFREGLGHSEEGGVDVDEYDNLCDHLVILDREKREVLGTYRLICSRFSDRFYSQSEFKIDGLLDKPGVKLEMGRACVREPYRTGAVLNLLWRGIVNYFAAVDARFLFGCASIKTTDPLEIASVYADLRSKGYMTDEYGISPNPQHTIPHLARYLTLAESRDVSLGLDRVKDKIPSLLESYFKAGAKVCGLPALDPEFKCIDFLTVLRIADLQGLYRRRYQAF